jgi:hypothetical protein
VGFRVCRNNAKTATGLENEAAVHSLICYPNPFQTTATIRFSLSNADLVRIRIYDPAGRLTATLAEHQFEPGVHSLAWKPENAVPGLYCCLLQTGSAFYIQKIQFQKP